MFTMLKECRSLKIAFVFSLSIGSAAAQLARPSPALHTALIPSPAVAQAQSPAASALSTEMLTAARNGDVASVKQLLAKGEDANATNPDGVTALMVAGAEDHLNVVLVLLEAGADARMKTLSGKTAAFFAAGRSHAEVAAVLKDAASKPPIAPKVSEVVKAAPPDPPKMLRDPAQAIEHYNKGLALYKAGWGHFDESVAEEEFRLTTVYNPAFAPAYYLRGQLLVQRASIDKDGTWRLPQGTLENYQTYLALDPNGQFSKAVRAVLTSMHQPLSSPDVDAKVAAIREERTNPVQPR